MNESARKMERKIETEWDLTSKKTPEGVDLTKEEFEKVNEPVKQKEKANTKMEALQWSWLSLSIIHGIAPM